MSARTNPVLEKLRELAEHGHEVSMAVTRRPGGVRYAFTVHRDPKMSIAVEVDDSEAAQAFLDVAERDVLRALHNLGKELQKRDPKLRSV